MFFSMYGCVFNEHLNAYGTVAEHHDDKSGPDKLNLESARMDGWTRDVYRNSSERTTRKCSR